MIYLLKFGASFILPPGIFFVLLLLCAVWVWRRGGKRPAAAIASVIFVFYLLSTSFVADMLIRNLESKYLPPENPSGDVIIMLGGGALLDTPDVNGTGTLCPSPANRLLTVMQLYRKLHVPILLSGGQVYADTGTESLITKRILMSLGIPEQDIITESQSLTTSQNAFYSAEILREKGFTKPILVTSAFHLPRAVICFEKQGVKVVPYLSDFQANLTAREVHYSRLRPDAGALSGSALVMQERLRALVTVLFE